VTQPDQLTVGFVAIARPTFDIPLATDVTGQVRSRLEEAGFSLRGPDTLISTPQQAEEAVQALSDAQADVLLVFQATFADSTMVMSLVPQVEAPLVMWAVPEVPTGGRLRLNSLCGINLAGHALTRAGHPYDTLYAYPNDPVALDKVRSIAQAGRVRRLLRGARIGRVGDHPPGFETCSVNHEALKQTFGLDVIQLDLQATFEKILEVDSQASEPALQRLDARLTALEQVDQHSLQGTLKTYIALRETAQQEGLSGFAVRCWPEFFTDLGCAACGASSLLSDSLIPASCEADVNGTVTLMILQWLSGKPVFDSDLVSFDMDQNTAVFWHCGKAPLSMADPEVVPRATIHSNRQLPLLMEFPLRPGRVTLARLSEATGSFRLVVGSGEVLKSPISFTGTSGVVRFDRPAREVLDTVLSEGLEHHLALVYGDYRDSLLALARMVDIPVLHL
jgi:L-fucose isomerase-like protein